MNPDNSTKLTYGALGLVLGAVLALWISVEAGYVITKNESGRRTNAALLESRAKVCVAQFTNDPRYPEKVKEFKALNFIDRDGFIEKGGWATIAGNETDTGGVSRVCGDKLASLLETT